MPNLSKQFLFAVGTGTTTATSVSITGMDVSPVGSNSFASAKEKADGYYNLGDGNHTVTYTVAPGFDGSITMQGTLALEPVLADWFNITGSTISYTASLGTTTTNYVNFTGNFVWVRALVIRNTPAYGNTVLAINYNH